MNDKYKLFTTVFVETCFCYRKSNQITSLKKRNNCVNNYQTYIYCFQEFFIMNEKRMLPIQR